MEDRARLELELSVTKEKLRIWRWYGWFATVYWLGYMLLTGQFFR